MKLRVIILLLALVGFATTATAQTDYMDSSNGMYPKLTQTITVKIPPRLALHLTETSYELNLNNLTAYDPTNVSGGFNWPTAEGCMMLPKGMQADVATEAARTDVEVGEFAAITKVVFNSGLPTANYPAVYLTPSGNVARDSNGNYLKGTLVCFNQKIIQKFANVPWLLSANVDISGAVGKFGIADDIQEVGSLNGAYDGRLESSERHVVTSSANGLTLARNTTNPTGGWLDDRITELFWFDGTETPGTHTILVTYTLTAL